MGGKRPDQEQMEPSATDRKTVDNDEHTHEEDKQALHTRRGKLGMPTRGENPALTDLKNRRRGKKG
ncbi:MAG TPA: hypothetical protein VKH19_00785 [Gemmatimonadaceae bacterium]|nr:hypothetical protein [Gemmatimonadaceae bacterium]